LVGEAPYSKPCNGCGKQIILGIDRENNKWRPWDDYNGKIKHNCSAKAVSNEKIASMGTGLTGTGAAKSEEVAIVHARVTEVQSDVKLLLFLTEKLCKKQGVDLDESNE
jgi:hypothetical protein